jgi:hypothetical protein
MMSSTHSEGPDKATGVWNILLAPLHSPHTFGAFEQQGHSMALIFIHGVNSRAEDPGYAAQCLLIEKFLKKHFTGATINNKALSSVTPCFPYWGGLATKFAWNMESLPSQGIDSLGTLGVDPDLRPLVATLVEQIPNPKDATGAPILGIAKRSLPQAVKVVSDLLLSEAKPEQSEEIAQFLFALQEYAEAHPSPAWLAALTTDPQLLSMLATEAANSTQTGPEALGVQSAGILNLLTLAATKFKGAVAAVAGSMLDVPGNFLSTHLLAWGRRPLNEVLGRFFGDVFVYLDTRKDKTSPGDIPKAILSEIDAAITSSPAQDPVIIIGHSLGGVITYDLLSHFRPDLEVDLFISFGSQVSHFEEIKRFKASDPGISMPNRVHPPPNIKHWINVFDPVDIFSYACAKIFERVQDFRYDTGTYTIKAHGAYFHQAAFYKKLRDRINALNT